MFPYSFMPPVRMMPPDGSSASRGAVVGAASPDKLTGRPVQTSGPIMEMQPGVADDPWVRARPVQRTGPMPGQGGILGFPATGPGVDSGQFGSMPGMGRFPFGMSQALFGGYMGGMGYGQGTGGRQYQPQFQNSLPRHMGAYLPGISRNATTPWMQSPEVLGAGQRPLAGQWAANASHDPYSYWRQSTNPTFLSGVADLIARQRQQGGGG